MLILLPTLLGPQNADPLARLRTAIASPLTIECGISSAGVSGTLTVAADGSVRSVSGSERLIHAGGEDWEYDDALQIYDRLPGAGPKIGGRVGTGRLTERAAALLVPFLVRRGAKGGLLDRRFERQGSTYTATAGEARLTLLFGTDRTLARVTLVTPVGGDEWRFSGFRLLPAGTSPFRTGIPTGYTEAFEPDVRDALRIGSPLPAKFNALAPGGAKAWLLAVLEPGVASSDGAQSWLGRLKANVPNVILANASAADRRALVAEDSPTYLLVRDRKILGVWKGYDPREEARIEGEIRAAIEESP